MKIRWLVESDGYVNNVYANTLKSFIINNWSQWRMQTIKQEQDRDLSLNITIIIHMKQHSRSIKCQVFKQTDDRDDAHVWACSNHPAVIMCAGVKSDSKCVKRLCKL